ncbi:MAG: transposase, partial [Paludibacteraceae bacterium]|nr:transposase [Paludibacteraceae bacterium]
GGANILTFDTLIKVHIGQFYGIEINDFACTVAKTALWIAENQMMQQTSAIAGKAMDFLPLKTNANIVEGNALRMDWASLGARSSSPASSFDYIIGNPPFVGGMMMSREQKQEMLDIFGKKLKGVGELDYVGAWYKKAAELMQVNTTIKAAFVSTNSITQGEQVAILWQSLMQEYGIQIDFAYRTFRWDSEADIKAHVHCVIIGFSHRARSSSSAKTKELKNHTRGYLPHFENQRFQTITFRLYDSVPRSIIEQWKTELGLLGARSSSPAISNTQSNNADEDVRAPREQQLRQLIDQYEDAGIGQCFFKDDRVAEIMENALYFYNGKRYNLIRWCIMPNHVHVLIELLGGWSVESIIKDWKSFTAHEANKVLGRKGDFWMPEYFDRYIRNDDHYRNAIDYIDNNPVKANLTDEATKWKWCSLGCDADGDVRAPSGHTPRIYISDNHIIEAENINGYLMNAPNVFIVNRNTPLCDAPAMNFGNMPRDGGGFILSEEEKDELLRKEPLAAKWIHLFLGATEFINNKKRYCLWLQGASPSEIRQCPTVMQRVTAVRDMRLASAAASTRKMAETSTLFAQITQPVGVSYILIPRVSSERRRYIPIGFVEGKTIASDAVQIIPSATLYHFGILTSNVHMAWMRVVCGRLKSDYRYSKDIVYNNFPWPMNAGGDDRVPSTAQAILDARAKYPDCSLADLYDEVTMPPELRKAHQDNDRAVMAAYGFSTKMTESECVAKLFEMYQNLTQNTPKK